MTSRRGQQTEYVWATAIAGTRCHLVQKSQLKTKLPALCGVSPKPFVHVDRWDLAESHPRKCIRCREIAEKEVKYG